MWSKDSIPFLQAETPLVMAHRGDSATIPENTLQAFEEAYELNVDVIETDLRLTKDDEIIFFHDKTVNRTTNGRGSVKSFTLKELKKLDQGYRFQLKSSETKEFPYRGKGLTVQSLEDILLQFPDMKFNMDIKDRKSRAAKVLARKLDELDAIKRVMVGSFHHNQLKVFRKISIVPTSASPLEVFLIMRKIKKILKFIEAPFENEQDFQRHLFGRQLPFYALQIPEKYSFVRIITSKDFMKAIHMIGLAVHVWTINKEEDMKRLLEWNVDGIFSDKPKLLQQVIKNHYKEKS